MEILTTSSNHYHKGKRKFFNRIKCAWKCLFHKRFIFIQVNLTYEDTLQDANCYYHNLKQIAAGYIMKRIGEDTYDIGKAVDDVNGLLQDENK